jgi:hypothetical protein
MDVATLTDAQPQIVYGVTFRCYRLAPGHFEWRSDDGRCQAGRTLGGHHCQSRELAGAGYTTRLLSR